MSSLQRWSFRSPVSDISREPTTSFVKQSTKPTDPRSGSLRFELAALLLLVATFAAILFRDAIVSRQFSLNPATISGGGAKTSGKVFESSASARMFQRESPPVSGAGMPKTTRPIRVSRIA